MMEKLPEQLEKIKTSKDSDEINTILIELGKNPKKEYLAIIDYFLGNYNPVIFSQIKLNLIYVLGQIGIQESLESKYLDFLIKEYYNSDRWVRNEIISAINKIANHTELTEQIFNILKFAIIDDYMPISVNAMKALMHYEKLPVILFTKIFKLLQNPDLTLQDHISSILMKFIKNEHQLYEILNTDEIYKSFTKNTFRFLLLSFFNTSLKMSNLESFRELLGSTEWEKEYIEMFFNEIDTYQKLFLKNV